MYIRRHLATPFLKANRFFPALLVTGARQVGKTTFLHSLGEPERRFVSLDTPDVREMARKEPRLFLDDNPPPLTIDEIQYAPELLPHIKERIDQARLRHPEQATGLYWLTGSQQFRMMHNVTESLAGRIGIFQLHGLSSRELGGAPEATPYLPETLTVSTDTPFPTPFFEQLWLGSYPSLLTSATPPATTGATSTAPIFRHTWNEMSGHSRRSLTSMSSMPSSRRWLPVPPRC